MRDGRLPEPPSSQPCAPPARPRAGRERKRGLPLQTSEIVLIASVACLVAAAAIQALITLVLHISAK